MSATTHNTYDYIIAGTGCAGLSLAMEFLQSGIPFQKILLLDREQKTANDRTWCYWSSDEERWYDRLATRKWNEFIFKDHAHLLTLQLAPYSYRLLQAKDFYRHCLGQLTADPRFEFLSGNIDNVGSDAGGAFVVTGTKTLRAGLVFNSALRHAAVKPSHINLVQHFVGWKVRTTRACFDPERPIFMDFSVPQKNDCRFVYVLPFSDHEALVEYTGFSPAALAEPEYEQELSDYMQTICSKDEYSITETERGLIPMYESPFTNQYGPHVINIGTAGGGSKASTGFTFYYIQQQVRNIVHDLKNKKQPGPLFRRKSKFLWYDRTLLQVMKDGKPGAAEIFSLLFRRSRTADLLAFLNEESDLAQDLRVMAVVPWSVFIPAALKKLFSR